MTIGHIKSWHRPSNDECAHNADIGADCNCKLVITGNGKKKHKPRIVFRVFDKTVSGRIKPQLVVEIHDDGEMTIRESKRRVYYKTTVGSVYSRLLWNHAMQHAQMKAKARRERRKSSR